MCLLITYCTVYFSELYLLFLSFSFSLSACLFAFVCHYLSLNLCPWCPYCPVFTSHFIRHCHAVSFFLSTSLSVCVFLFCYFCLCLSVFVILFLFFFHLFSSFSFVLPVILSVFLSCSLFFGLFASPGSGTFIQKKTPSLQF